MDRPLYEIIAEAAADGALPEDFRLPGGKGHTIRFVPGVFPTHPERSPDKREKRLPPKRVFPPTRCFLSLREKWGERKNRFFLITIGLV